MKSRIMLVPATALAAAVAVAPAAPAKVAGNESAGIHDKRDRVTVTCTDQLAQEQGTITWDGPVQAWPPNHKYRTATITATDTDAEPLTDGVEVAVTGTHDEVMADASEMNGAGNTDPATDVVPGAPGVGTGSAVTSVQFRGERSGRGDGRVYTFLVEATFDSGMSPCTKEFEVTVPHDMRGGGGKTKGSRKARTLRRR